MKSVRGSIILRDKRVFFSSDRFLTVICLIKYHFGATAPSGRTEQKNIWHRTMTSGTSTEKFVHHDQEPNIFLSGSTKVSG